MELTYVEKKQRSADAFSFIFEPKQEIIWQAGQYMDFEIPHDRPDERGTHRWFTISSAPFEKNIMITTRISGRGSTFKKALDRLEPGSIIVSGLPRGDFVLEGTRASRVFIAGGIGITPFRSMLQQLHFEKKNPKIELLYLNKDDDFVFKGELDRLQSQMSNFQLTCLVNRRLDEDMLKKFPDNYFYLSGPRAMVESYQQMLEDIVSPEKIKTDYFPGY